MMMMMMIIIIIIIIIMKKGWYPSGSYIYMYIFPPPYRFESLFCFPHQGLILGMPRKHKYVIWTIAVFRQQLDQT